jgi:hypothetical protein
MGVVPPERIACSFDEEARSWCGGPRVLWDSPAFAARERQQMEESDAGAPRGPLGAGPAASRLAQLLWCERRQR